MANIGFVVPPLLGHLNPMLAIAEQLASRGHRITFFSTGDVSKTVCAAGFDFVKVGRQNSRLAIVSGGRQGLLGMPRLVSELARTTQWMAQRMIRELSTGHYDIVLVDQHEPGGGLAARIVGIPYISVANALPINRDAGVPPYFSHWQPDVTRWGRERDAGAFRVYDLVLAPVNRVLQKIARANGLRDVARSEDCLSQVSVAQISPDFDFPRRHTTVEGCGPFRSRADMEQCLQPFGEQPLVFASFGTLQGSRFGLFQRIAEACRDVRAQLVIAHGGLLTADQVRRLKPIADAVPFVDQPVILRRAAVAVTHAGMNTMMDVIAAGRPCLALPMAYDQPGIAARVVSARCGLRVMPWRASKRRLRAALEVLLSDVSIAERCEVLRQSADRLGGAGRVADIVDDRLLSGRRPRTVFNN